MQDAFNLILQKKITLYKHHVIIEIIAEKKLSKKNLHIIDIKIVYRS